MVNQMTHRLHMEDSFGVGISNNAQYLICCKFLQFAILDVLKNPAIRMFGCHVDYSAVPFVGTKNFDKSTFSNVSSCTFRSMPPA